MSRGFTSEMVAAVTKLMSNMDLVYGAKKIRVTANVIPQLEPKVILR